MKTRIVLLAITATVIFGACSKSNGGNSSDSQTSQGADESKLQGNWKDSCRNYGGGGYERSSFNAISFTGSNLVMSGRAFNGKTCTGSPTDTLTMKFKFEIPSHSSVDPSILNFDGTIQSLSWIVYDQDTVNAFNTMATCGFTDWMVGIEKDIAGLSCITGPNQAGTKSYSILKVNDVALQFGEPDNAHDGTTEPLRHIVLGTKIFDKVPGN